MGKLIVELEIANYDDVRMAECGHLAPEKVRRTTLRGIVNPNVRRPILPKALVKELGLPIHPAKVKARDSRGRWRLRSLAEAVEIQMLGRGNTYSAIVDPGAETVVIGWMVLNVLDFVLNETKNRLTPRDPRFVIVEL